MRVGGLGILERWRDRVRCCVVVCAVNELTGEKVKRCHITHMNRQRHGYATEPC